MPGATGNATSIGDIKIGAAQLPLSTPLGGQELTAGAFTSDELPTVGLPGLSIAFSNDGAASMTVQVHIYVQNNTAVVDLPAFVVAAGVDAYVSYDHNAARSAYFTVVGTGTQSFRAILGATAT